MTRLLNRLKQIARKGQTTSEYVIILGLIALGSIAVILLFGNQIRALFGAGTKKVAGESSQVEKFTSGVDDAVEVENLGEAFENP